MENLFTAGRLIFGMVLLYMGVRNFFLVGPLVEESTRKNIPFPKLAVIGSTIWLIVGSLFIVFNFYILIGGALVSSYLVITGLAIHNFWTAPDPEGKIKEMIQVEKNFIMAAAALAIAAAAGQF